MIVDWDATPETLKRYRFMRLLGEELQRGGVHQLPPGTQRHFDAMDEAWRSAERRERGGL